LGRVSEGDIIWRLVAPTANEQQMTARYAARMAKRAVTAQEFVRGGGIFKPASQGSGKAGDLAAMQTKSPRN
jgi:hypothetical protein